MLAQLGQLVSPGKGLSEEVRGANGDSLKEQLRSLCSRRGSRVSEIQRGDHWPVSVCPAETMPGRSVEKTKEAVSGEG